MNPPNAPRSPLGMSVAIPGMQRLGPPVQSATIIPHRLIRRPRRADVPGVQPIRNPNPLAETSQSRPEDRRTAGRVHVEDLQCNRGQVLDLSQTGAKLLTRRPWPQGKVRTLVFLGGRIAVTVEARCVWTWKEGLFRHIVGVYFERPTEEQTRLLADLARDYALRVGPYGEAT